MPRAYRTEPIPGWVWIVAVIAALLILLVALSMAMTRGPRQVVVTGPEVQTGDPRNFVGQPAPTPETETPPPVAEEPETPPPPPIVEPPPPPDQPGRPPAGMPESFVIGGRTWRFSDGPIELDVETTGEHIGERVIYRRPGMSPPYRELFIEIEPNSNRFYRYMPA